MKLLQSLNIRGITLKNRMVAAAIGSNGGEDGFLTDYTKNYYKVRAKGQWGMITFEATAPRSPGGLTLEKGVALSDDKYIPGMREVVESVHAYDTPIILQIIDGGRNTNSKWGGVPFAPSRVRSYTALFPDPPKIATLKEIDWLVENYVNCAERAMKAGFDGIEVQCGHGYLISGFISPFINRRKDEYGGSVENRMRFPLRIIRGIREVIGEKKILSVRVNATDLLQKGGLELEEGHQVAKMMVDAGVDLVNVSAGLKESTDQLKDYTMATNPHGAWVFMGISMKKALGKNVPVAIANRINTPELAEQILQETDIDLIELGRGCVADYEFPKKVIEGRSDDIHTCISCPGCGGSHMWPPTRPDRQLNPFTCTVNPMLRHDAEGEDLKPAQKVKNILIAGGGPAGMEAAIILADRGHHVTLCEKSKILGGQMRYSARIRAYQDFETLANNLSYQVYKRPINVRLGTEVTPKFITEFKPDALIVATGVDVNRSTLAGANNTEVNIVYAHDLFKEPQAYEWAKLGKRVAVLCRGVCCTSDSWFGCETIAALLDRDKEITFITNFDDMLAMAPWPGCRFFRFRMESAGVSKLVKTKFVRLYKNGVVVEKDGKEEVIGIDSLILATVKSNKQLSDIADRVAVKEIHYIGDCAKTGCVETAISDGFIIGRKI